MTRPPATARWPAIIALSVALLALAVAAAALVVASQPAPDPVWPPTPTPSPIPNDAMWSVGTGGHDEHPYIEWVAIYPTSTRWDILGAPSLRFTDHAPALPDQSRSFEIGFYKYGPTWYTRNPIVEFWLGGPEHRGGSLSIIGNDHSGGQLEVRNPADTEQIALDYRDPRHPTLRSTHPTNPLIIAGQNGIVSETKHTFVEGIAIPPSSDYAGKVVSGGWRDGALTVQTTAIRWSSLVIVTPLSEPRGRWWVGAIAPGESFTVRSTAPDEQMAFNWLLIN
ncbi:MAG TPA: hypothetical protein PKD46_02380 [Aggregatilineaceae bacterium]|jgi:hypothetical protein|nr:hypothetical protein [Anaerolineae bacterium]HMM27107.1 hypothetical protein [Aggregatilineaceae bacterium]